MPGGRLAPRRRPHRHPRHAVAPGRSLAPTRGRAAAV